MAQIRELGPVRRLSEFVRLLEDNENNEETLREREIFRGHHRSDWQLLPYIGRITPRRGTLLETERRMFEDFRKRSSAYSPYDNLSDLDLLCLARHYSLPVRLLDWTTRPLIALWFTVSTPHGHGDREKGVVWGLDTGGLEEETGSGEPIFEARSLKLVSPRYLDGRISAQHSVFTLHPNE